MCERQRDREGDRQTDRQRENCEVFLYFIIVKF